MESNPLSASKIKTLQTCSYMYWAKYHLGIPDSNNDGSRRGSICHLIFELLGKSGRENKFNNIINTRDVFSEPSIKRLIFKHAIREGIADETNINMMKEMILNGLLYDFFGDTHGNPDQAESELAFVIKKNEDGVSYHIRGFIDKLFLYKKKKYALIRDFKSSKKPFNSYEIDDNLQDLMYSLAVKKLFPEYVNRQSEFLFLKFELDPSYENQFIKPKNKNGKLIAPPKHSSINSGVIRMAHVSDSELRGFEHFLTEIQNVVDNFNEEMAQASMAYAKGFPKPEEGFAGKLVCGNATKHGQLKKDGTPAWCCPFKLARDYFAAIGEDGEVLKTAHTKEELTDFKKVEKKRYLGCPAFRFDNSHDLI
jgi:hypothetical protein